VKRVATFQFRSAPPASVDEELAMYDDGSVRLAVRRPRSGDHVIGTYAYSPHNADFAELAKAGPNAVDLDLLGPVPEGQQDLVALASRVADEAREHPEATASFYARAVGQQSDGRLGVALQVVAGGTRVVEFDLAPDACTVLFTDSDGQPAGWAEFPKLELGFVTTDAEDLGGLRRRAEIKPGDWGTVVVKVSPPAAATGVSVRVAGSLYEGLPDDRMGTRFEALTDQASL
jgi:hypothetical protein